MLDWLPVPGDVLALLTKVQDLQMGFYLLQSIDSDWATLRVVIDEPDTERLIVTDRVERLPMSLLDLFTPVGIHLSMSH